MDKHKLWVIGAVLVTAVIVAGGWEVGIQPQLTAAAASASQLASVTTVNQNASTQLATLRSEYVKLPSLEAQLALLQQSVPSSTNFPTLLNEFNSIAATTGVTLSGFTFADATPYAPVAPPVVAAPVAASTSSTSSTSTPTPSPSPSPAATTTPATVTSTAGVPPYTSPEITASNFVTIPFSLTTVGTYPATLAFVKQLQSAHRLVLVTTLTTSYSESDPSVFNSTIGGLIYVLASAAAPATTPAG